MPPPGFWSRVREARLARVLLVYLAASWLVLQVASLLQDRLELPRWVTPLTFLLLLVGLVVVSATAWVQSHPGTKAMEEVPAPWEIDLRGLLGSLARARLPHLTWARALLGGLVAFSLLFGAAGIYVLVGQRGDAEVISERRMLLVLPFENLGSAEDEYFADGITEEIMSRLAGIHGLGVIARTTATQYKNTDKTIKQIGEDLGVEYVLEGTVRWERSESGLSRVRVTPQLIRVEDATHLWSDRYDAVLAEIFRVQSDIAERVAGALNVTLLAAERRAIEARPTENLEAYDYYLRGSDYHNRGRDKEAWRVALGLYQRAIELDPGFVSAYVRLAKLHADLYWYFDKTEERLAASEKAADRAVQLRPDLSEVHEALGWYHYRRRDFEIALKHFAAAIGGQPNDAEVLEAIGEITRRQGKWDEAAQNFRRAFQLDPRSSLKAMELALTYHQMRRYQKAEKLYDRAISLSPDQFLPYSWKARLYVSWQGNGQKAAEVLREGWKGAGPPPWFAGRHPWWWWLFRIIGPGSKEILDGLTVGSFPTDSGSYFLAKTELYSELHRGEVAHAYYDSARAFLERKVQLNPEDAGAHSELGVAYAGLGRREEAVWEGQKAIALVPIREDALDGPNWVAYLAQIYVMVGEHDAAIDQLESLLSVPGWISISWLQADPVWNPLRRHPRFQRLLATDSRT